MNKDLILKYQEKDSQLYKLEKELEQNEDKKIANQMISIVRDMQNKSSALEQEAEVVVKEFEKFQQKSKEISLKAHNLAEIKIDSLSSEEAEKLIEETSEISNALTQIEKKCVAQAEKVSNILSEFEESKKKFGLARSKHSFHKSSYEQAYLKVKPTIDALKQELSLIEKELPSTVVAKYKLVRQDKIFPVFVPLMSKSCGGCAMELSTNKIETLKQKGFIECENCHRQIYIEN